METRSGAVQDYTRYIKCGEILKSPVQKIQNSIILKCFHCNEVHFSLESFVTHIQEHFQDVIPLVQDVSTRTRHKKVHEDEIEKDAFDNLDIKLEEIDDPLLSVKCELGEENECKKDEVNTLDLDTYNKESDLDDFEDLSDSPEEFEPDDESDSDEEYVIKEVTKKRTKSCVEDSNKFDSESDADEERSNTKKQKVSPYVENFMMSKPNVLILIELYKNHPNLWDKHSPFHRIRDQKRASFEEITLEINEKCCLKLTWKETAEIISYIYTKHRADFKSLHYHTNKKKKKSKNGKDKMSEIMNNWFFDSLSFLRSKAVATLQNIDSNIPDLTTEQIIKILEIYQSVPNLWNTYLIENICTNKRQDSLEDMVKILEKDLNLKIDLGALEKYIRTIHDHYSREKRKILGISTSEDLEYFRKNNSPKIFEHMLFLEDHEGPFNCPECDGIFNKPLLFRIHKSTHDGTMPLKCSQCDQEFKNVSTYTTHGKRHLEDLQFICKACNMKFLRHSDLKKHLFTHTDERPYCCELCGASYRQLNSFRKHQRQHEKRFTHTCHICSKGYYRKHKYVDHMNSHMNIRQYICNICGKAFITSRALKTHAVTHDDARNHACELCGKTFKLKIGVLQHMRTHGRKVETEKNNFI